MKNVTEKNGLAEEESWSCWGGIWGMAGDEGFRRTGVMTGGDAEVRENLLKETGA